MFEFIRGDVAHIDENYAALDVGGVGFKIFASGRCLQGLKKGEQATLFTYLAVREDDMTLYGFASAKERQLFLRLISISGVGPKAGMAILSAMSSEEVVRAAISGDAKTFSRVNGIGPKTAGRIVLELKDKVDIEDAIGGEVVGAAAEDAHSPIGEAVEALLSIGYERTEALEAVAAVKDLADTAEDLTLLALNRLSL